MVQRHDLPPPPAPSDPDDAPAEPEPEPDEPAVERIPLDADFALPFADELRRALPGCAGPACAIPGAGVEFRFGTHKGSKGRLFLDTLERIETVPSC